MIGDRPTNHTIDVYPAFARSYACNIDFCSASTCHMSVHMQADVNTIDEIDAYWIKVILASIQV